MSAEKNIATHLAHAGGKPDQHTGAVVPGIDPATTFARDETYATYALKSASHLYSRDDNDLYRQAEALIARMEGARKPGCSLLRHGRDRRRFPLRAARAVVIVQSGIYWDTTAWVRKFCKRNGIALVECDVSDNAKLVETLSQTAADLVFIETPSNPTLKVTDIKAAADAAHNAGAVLAADATTATPPI
ncbi:PLP-dependent transferase [Breoghania sp.]|uniref:PLP-dependent transferase n=1 Tax=Breoghania sp. TaxID=2065378 RepID=UPI00262ED0A4|nr:PLP-dependent transferase [Breoghania sp.]MDJ0931356.1 PLP-dependent transferase [Breoghania sp.]